MRAGRLYLLLLLWGCANTPEYPFCSVLLADDVVDRKGLKPKVSVDEAGEVIFEWEGPIQELQVYKGNDRYIGGSYCAEENDVPCLVSPLRYSDAVGEPLV